jgi:hypothetical protein
VLPVYLHGRSGFGNVTVLVKFHGVFRPEGLGPGLGLRESARSLLGS